MSKSSGRDTFFAPESADWRTDHGNPSGAGRCRVAKFNGLDEFVETVERHGDRAIGPRSFVGRYYANIQQAAKDLRRGWPEAVAEVERMLTMLDGADLPRPACVRRRARWDQADGDEFDRDRLHAGADPWRAMRRQSVVGPQDVSIVVDVCTAARVSWEKILWRGVAALAIASRLEEAGYRVSIDATCHVTGCYKSGVRDALVVVPIKDAGRPMDLTSLVATVSGWAFRTVWFQAIELMGPARDDLGIPATPPGWLVRSVWPDLEGAVWLQRAMSFDEAAELAKQKLHEVAARSGGSTAGVGL